MKTAMETAIETTKDAMETIDAMETEDAMETDRRSTK
jgi:hypothetical protein